jgi:hypothetical protein
MLREALSQRHPHGIRTQHQGPVLAEGQMNRIHESMVPKLLTHHHFEGVVVAASQQQSAYSFRQFVSYSH